MDKVKLNDFCDIMNGHSFRGKIKPIEDGNVSVIQLSDINELQGIDFNNLVRTRFEPKKEDVFLKKGDVLCVSKGPRLYAICLGEVPEKTLASFHMSVIRVSKDNILPEFVSWHLNNSQKYFLRNSQGGSGVTHMSKSKLEELPVALPSIEAQETIKKLEILKKKEKKIMKRLGSLREVITLEYQKALASQKIKNCKEK